MTAEATIRSERRHLLTVCTISGEIDPTNVADAAKALLEALQPPCRGLIVDVDSLAFIDSAGIAMLFDLARRARQENIRFALAASPAAAVGRVLEIARLDGVAILAPSLDDAVRLIGDLAS